MGYRWRDIPSLPLLFLLHILFTLSSLIVRLYEGITVHPPEHHAASPPRHVALVLAPGIGDTATPSKRKKGEASPIVESVRRVVQWAGDEGVDEVSIWDKNGSLLKYERDIVSGFQRLPLSPPSSGPSTPTKRNSSLPRSLAPERQDRHHQTFTHTLYPASARPLRLHLLPPSSTLIIAEITRNMANRGTTVTQKALDAAINGHLGFKRDPDLLIVHHISSPSFFRALLPRPPPELHGYPFWPLRITEIYQHPTPLPFPQPLRELFSILLDRAQFSSLPLIRKIARSIPARSPSATPFVSGAISRDEWEGAMQAWSQVEQRLGK